jgi:hypothetical protein
MWEWRDIHDWLDENCPDWQYNVSGGGRITNPAWEHPSQRHDNVVKLRNAFAYSPTVLNQKPIYGMIRVATDAEVTKVLLRWNADYIGRAD